MFIDPNEAQTMLVEVCSTVISTLAEENKIDKTQLNIRIDLENSIATPVFALFNQSAFIQRADLKAIIRAGGGAAFGMILQLHVKDAIRNIFESVVKQLQAASTKDVCLRLFLRQQNATLVPYMTLYHKGVEFGTLPLSELIGADQ